MLQAKKITIRFGGLTALYDVSICFSNSDIFGLIGPNGAGKTTLINALTGFQKFERGSTFVDSINISRLKPHLIARIGIARTFQGGRLFGRLSALENAESGAIGIGLNRKKARKCAMEILGWMGLLGKSALPANSLPYGDIRKIGIARALASNPNYLLLDEPGAGLNDFESAKLMEMILKIRDDFKCGILLVEHNMRLVMGVCERVHVLNGGRSLVEGTPEEIQSEASFRQAYLGNG